MIIQKTAMEKIRNQIYKLLRKSEKYTKTDMVYLAKGGFWLVGGQVIAALSGIVLAIGFANLLPKEVYGNYKFILSLAGIVGAFTLTGMGAAIIQAVARGFEGMLRVGFWIQFKWSIFMVLVALSGAIYYFLGDNNTIAISLVIIGLLSPLMTSTSLYGAFLTGKKDFKTAALYNIFRNTIPAGLLLVTLLFTQNIILMVLVYFLSHTATNTFLYLITLKKYKPTQTTDYSNITYGKHLSFINILNLIATHMDKILVFHYLGATQLAIYAFALMIPAQINGVLKNISVLAFPKFSKQKKEDLKKALFTKTIKLLAVSVLITSLYIITAPILFSFLFPQYLDSIFYSQIFSLNIILTGGAIAVATFFQSHKLIKESYLTTILGNLLRILLMFILISQYGIIGIILAILISRLITVLLSFVLAKQST